MHRAPRNGLALLAVVGISIVIAGCVKNPESRSEGPIETDCGRVGQACCPGKENPENLFCEDRNSTCQGTRCCALPGGPTCDGPEDCCGGLDCAGDPGQCCSPLGTRCNDGLCCDRNAVCRPDADGVSRCIRDDGGSTDEPRDIPDESTCGEFAGDPCCEGGVCYGWLECEEGMCVSPGGVEPPDTTPDCTASSCAGCTSLRGCGWCDGACVAGDSGGSDDGQCRRVDGNWQSASYECAGPPDGESDCASATACGECGALFGCGWCHETSSCMAGTWRGPKSSGTAEGGEEGAEETGPCTGDTAGSWDFHASWCG